MTKTPLPTPEAIGTLTSYLPRLYADGFKPVDHWYLSEKHKDGSFTVPYPRYNLLVDEFFRYVAGDGWLDYEYNPSTAYEMLKDESAVKAASLEQIRSMLTFCMRGERFSDGHWEQMILEGHVRRLLERLNEIKSTLMR